MEAIEVVHWTRDPAIALSAEGRVLAMNDAFERLTHASASGMIGRLCVELTTSPGGANARPSCVPARCSALRSIAAGQPVGLHSCPLQQPVGAPAAKGLAAITIPAGERGDGAAAVFILCTSSTTADTPSTPPSGGGVSLQFFGEPECTRAGAAQRIARRRVLELLALLALNSTGVPRSRVIDTLWPDADPARARAHLRVLLHGARHALGNDVLEEAIVDRDGREPRLCLSHDVWTDVAAFQRATARDGASPPDRRCSQQVLLDPDGRLQQIDAAIELYRGDLDVAGSFGAWSVPHRERLRMQLLVLLAEAAPLAMALGDVDRSVQYCERAIQADPTDEAFRIALITTYGHLGRRPAALFQYRDYERVLALELGLRPSPTTTRALQQALKGAPAIQRRPLV